jgi:hypothetical protein
MSNPARAKRLWLALAVGTLWLVRVGGAEEAMTAAPLPELGALDGDERPKARRWRLVSVFARGWIEIVVALLKHRRRPLGRMLPEPWPTIPELPQLQESQTQRRHVA